MLGAKILIIPIISAFIGYITNYIAVKMLFHPRKPVRLVFFTIQGIFPKRQKQLAEKLGKVVGSQLFTAEEAAAAISSENTQAALKEKVEEKVSDFVDTKLATAFPMLAMFLSAQLKDTLKTKLNEELVKMIPELLNVITNKVKTELNIEEIVAKKVSAFSSDNLEELLFSIMKKEFRFIELLGGILGLLIGIVQVIITII